MPDRITIFQGPHERLARGDAQLRQMVEETVWHEVAHYFGMDERQVRAAEARFARRGQEPRFARRDQGPGGGGRRGPGGREGAAVPGLDDVPRDRH